MVKRKIEDFFQSQIKRNKSILLLGPRQTGKTTLIKNLQSDLFINLAETTTRRRYELSPDLISKEVQSLTKKSPLVIIDEIQKVPQILDPIQSLIDAKVARFILTGSSARKLRRQSEINLLPGRVVSMHMDSFTHSEYPQDIELNLLFGSLPGIATEVSLKNKNIDLRSYVDIYLEEEVRAEALVRNLPAFYRFLEVAALESGKIVSFNSISQTLGVAHTTVSSYFEILEDCMIVERIDPIVKSTTRKKLTKSSKYLFFDSGVRRVAAKEGTQLGATRMGELFENYIGLELIRECRLKISTQVHFWRDPDGPEVEWVIKSEGNFIPIEVKLSSQPTISEVKHLITFLKEYPCSQGGYIVCTTPRAYKVSDKVTALPWQKLGEILKNLE